MSPTTPLAPTPSLADATFAELGVSPGIVSQLAERGIRAPFAVQVESIPAALSGRDVCGKAPTGSGKTLAFGVPLAERVGAAKPGRPRGLVLVPTRELASQIVRDLRPMLATRQRRVAEIFGGVSFGPQVKQLRQGVDVLVACPGRLADLVDRGDVTLGDIDFVVLDEADRMADMGFLPQVRRLLDQTAPQRQTLLFSATLDGDVDVLIRRYQTDPLHCAVQVPHDDAPDRVTHAFRETARDNRVEVAAQLVMEHGSAVVFCRTKHGADRVARQLTRAGVEAVAIHGNRSQPQRERALAAFAGGKALALVATDVAARGIHVDDVGVVIHFDLPADVKDYVHRSGRTGRAGAAGAVVSFVTDDDTALAARLQRDLGLASPAEARPRRSSRRRGGGAARFRAGAGGRRR